MSWQNPLAWIGLLAVAGPVLVHLIARRRIRTVRFPTVRFLDPSKLTPERRRRVTDPGLLSIRIGIVAAAVAAVAQPLFLTSDRERSAASRLVRAVVIDRSPSMSSSPTDGLPAIATARARAAALVAEAEAGVVLEHEAPAAVLGGAAAWLEAHPGRRELIVISDFQGDAVTRADLDDVSESVGLRFVQLETTTPDSAELTFHLGDRETRAAVALTPEATAITWETRLLEDPADGPTLLAAEDELAAAQRLLRAVRRLSRAGTAGRVAVVFPGYPGRPDLVRAARPIDTPWMFDLLTTLREDAAVTRAAAVTAGPDIPAAAGVLSPVVLDREGRTLAFAGAGDVDGIPHLLIFLNDGPESRTGAALLSAIPAPAGDHATSVTELVRSRLPAATLRGWERDAVPSSIGTNRPRESDSRWFWLLALLLLGVETVVRRGTGTDTAPQPEAGRAKVA